MIKSKRAGTLSIIAWVVGTIVIIIWLAGFTYFFSSITSTLVNIPAVNNVVNISSAATSVFVPVNNAMGYLPLISFILIVMNALVILVESYYIKQHPVLFIVHLFIVVLAVVASIYISNEYELLMNNNILSSTIINHTASSYLVLWLPYITAILGFFGFIIMLINFNRDPELRGVGI
jgi:hypothetical protein